MPRLLPTLPVLGLIAMAMSLSHLLPLFVSLATHDGTARLFAASLAVNFVFGLVLWLATRRYRRELQLREGILFITLVWVGGALFACFPLLFGIGLSFTDAYFESMSALTATGATLLEGLDQLPPAINVWRAELQWLGGMGVIVLVVAVLPMIGVGGRQITKAEIPGPMKDDQLTPRMTQTAKGLWMVYFALTLACLLSYKVAGMSWLDALIHSFTTLSLGGFSSHDGSIAYFDSIAIELVAIVFMTLAGINFATHFRVWQARRLAAARVDTELPYYLLVLALSVVGIALFLWFHDVYPDLLTALRYAAFNTISVATNTGYATVDYAQWPVFAPLWLMFLGTFAACSGSAGGGIKLIRAIILYRQMYRELNKLAHPNAVSPLKIHNRVVPNQVVFSVLAFFFAWLATLVGTTLLLTASGLDALTAFSASVASLNNIGPGLHEVGPSENFSVLTDFQTWVCSIAMLLGRLELLTVLVILTPAFWRK
ncbi:MAG: trk system potassium uptake rane protein [Betaproteobacteria bacterium]|jgi:trk system potassium uptake protein TrkH|nr:trk system potassium uptake rane protein [Betaproteobacteria bacterium]MEA3156212.1 trk/ktr system potassium uptake protein [Betaproteobacteria bacterium]